MTQLIMDTTGMAVTLPESRKKGYSAEKQPLSVNVEMISGRMTSELRGNVWVINYQYGYFNDTEKNNVIAVCEKGRKQAISCAFLPPNSNTMISSRFLVTSFTYPKFMWSRLTPGAVEDEEGNNISEFLPVPMWGNFSLTLREVEPSD